MMFKTIDKKMIDQRSTFILIAGNDSFPQLIESKVDIRDDILETTCKNMDNETKERFLDSFNTYCKLHNFD